MSAVETAGVDLGQYIGSNLAGLFACLVLYGSSIMQTFIYYVAYPKDNTAQKLLVAVVFLLDTLHAFFVCAGVWNYLIQDYGDLPNVMVLHVPTTLIVLVTPCVSFLVQSYFVWRIRFLGTGHFKWVFPAVMMPCITLQPDYVAKLLINPAIADTTSPLMIEVANVCNGTAAAVDIIITITMCTFLAMGRTRFNANTDRMFLRLIIISINTGLWTALFALVSVFPTNWVYTGFYFPLCTLYCNTLIANFNVRSYAQGSDEVYRLPTISASDSDRSDRSGASWNPASVTHPKSFHRGTLADTTPFRE
ncbi:hypothetical protein HYDPIDRAFT_111427 [Hydnomerulius pinastri MD-312]|uniref:DUF6534 domain-containing protein n=1 Tax=Hydnomerulius pinastri MD-312 TaxID=994086 RepID=A0A0C9VGV0_9AGAM|nr:hypothetical protein HYDPIDRAFT_111427 [Hydnomerulius pinastri MD-312]